MLFCIFPIFVWDVDTQLCTLTLADKRAAQQNLLRPIASLNPATKTTAKKSRSMYEYENIIILSTLHNPLEFQRSVVSLPFALSLCAAEAFLKLFLCRATANDS